MASFRGSFRRFLAVWLGLVAVLGVLYGIALMVASVTGSSSPGSILLGGLGFILVILSLLLLIFAVKQWTLQTPGQDNP